MTKYLDTFSDTEEPLLTESAGVFYSALVGVDPTNGDVHWTRGPGLLTMMLIVVPLGENATEVPFVTDGKRWGVPNMSKWPTVHLIELRTLGFSLSTRDGDKLALWFRHTASGDEVTIC